MNGKKTYKGKKSTAIKGTVIGVAVTFVTMLLLSAVMLIFNISENFAVPFATISVALGSFSAAFYTARKVGNKGYLIGIIVGLVSFAAVLLVSLLVSKQSIGVNTLFHLVIILISSMIGGILGINSLVKSKKYI